MSKPLATESNEHRDDGPGARGTIIWIIHRHDRGRAALMRLVGDGAATTVVGAPTDDLFASAPEPDAVVLGLEGDFELELEFVHRTQGRLAGSHWILLAGRGELDEVRRLFDTLPAEVLGYPPDPARLRRSIRAGLAQRPNDPLSRRRSRDLLAARFAHWFADLELPELIRTLDPQLGRVPVLIVGEPGTGRSLVARYIHEFGGNRLTRAAGSLIHVPCTERDHSSDLLGRIHDAIRAAGGGGNIAWTLWLQDVQRLPLDVQLQLRGWVEFGLPPGPVPIPALRWIATASDDSADDPAGALDPALARVLSGIAVRVPPLRERVDAIEPVVADTAQRWSRTHRRQLQRFGDDALRGLREYPWPGNLEELEAVVERTLAGSAADPIREEHLRFDVSNETAVALRAPEPESNGAAPPARAPEAVSRPEPAARPSEPQRPAVSEPPAGPSSSQSDAVQRLVGAVSHELRNPLTTIRTFTELLPEHFDDEEFRTRFAELVGSDVRRMEEALGRLQELAGLGAGERKPVDVAAMLEELLDERRDTIRARSLLVLRELDRAEPFALADGIQLQRALGGMLDRALALVPERGDVYLASRHHESGAGGRPTVRVLLRFDQGRRDRAPTVEGTTEAEASLEFIVAEAVVRAQGGSLTLDTTENQEAVVVIDLPAPSTP
ncbi:MAG: histidine kinase dimerization/phospho-acceptor domain-containing protein [Myxococcota bacterium]